jgi:ABC-type branched-subunit amino acid transport system substrate-binding protein
MGTGMRGRRQTYVALVGLAVGSLAAGLVLPFVSGERTDATVSAGGAALGDELGPGGGDGGATTTVAPTTPGGGGTDVDGATVSAGGGSVGPLATSGPAGPAGATTDAPLRATDVGVTAGSIKVGVVLLDLSTARSVGLAPENYELEDQRRAYDTFFGRVNEQGGINGRKVEVAYAVADPFRNETADAACIALTRDQKVFAVVSVAGFRGTASLCVTRDHKTPLIAQGHHPSEYFAASAGLLVTDLPSSERVAKQYVGMLARLGVLKGRTIGVVTNRDATNGEKQGGDAVVAAVKAAGFEVAHRADLSEDLTTGAGQVPVQVQQMRSAGVDAVLLASNFLYSTQFVQAADGQGWRPGWFVGHIGDMTSDALARNMPAGFDGAIGITSARFTHDARAKLPEQPVERECREYYNATTGQRISYGSENPVLPACAGVRVFAAAAQGAGPELTKASFSAAAQRLGRFPWPGIIGGSLGPGKLDFADEVRQLRWRADCKCFHVTGDPQRVG